MFLNGLTLTETLIFWAAEALLVAALMYFHFRARPSTWVLKLVTVFTVAVTAIFSTFALLLVAVSFGDSFVESVPLLVISSIPITYAAALLASGILLLVDVIRLRVSHLLSDPPDCFFSFYWTPNRLAKLLICVPIILFAVSVLGVEIATHIPSTSPITLYFVPTGSGFERGNFDLVRPLIFRTGEAAEVKLRRIGFFQEKVICDLSAPGFSFEEIQADKPGQQVRFDGATAVLPDCFWIVRANQKGTQSFILRVSTRPSDSGNSNAADVIPDV